MADYCGNCGKPQREGERFCRYCGKPFATVQAASAPPVVEEPEPVAPVAASQPEPVPVVEPVAPPVEPFVETAPFTMEQVVESVVEPLAEGVEPVSPVEPVVEANAAVPVEPAAEPEVAVQVEPFVEAAPVAPVEPAVESMVEAAAEPFAPPITMEAEPTPEPSEMVWAQPMPVHPPAAAAPPLTQAPKGKKAAKPAEAKPAKAGRKRKTSPLLVVLVALVALGACVACVWFGGKALLERWDPFNFLTPTATPDTSQAMTLASVREVIGPDGGTLALDTGIKLIFPAGAVGAKTEVVVKQLDATRFTDENTEAVLLDCTAGVATFDKPVEIRVPLPDWFTPETADAAWSGVWNEETQAVEVEPSKVEMVDGKPVLVVQANHFSGRVTKWFKEWLARPPNQADTLEVPYYSQSGGYCWAAVLQMLNESAKHSFTSEEFSVIGMIGVDDAGLGARAAEDLPSIRALVRAETNSEPERVLWPMGTDSPMLTYIQRQIAFFKRPVALIYAKHAVVFVGYDGTNFTVHDPQGIDGDIYKVTTFAGLGTGMLEEETTIVLTATLATDRPLVTVNIKDKSLSFIKPTTATPGDQFEFRWDYEVDTGYSWYGVRQSAVVATIPAEASKLKFRVGGENGVEIANSHLKDAVDVTVRVDIYSHGPGKTHYSYKTTMSLAPGQAKALSINDIPVSAFRDPSPSAVDYTLEILTVVGGKTVDEARVDFVLEPGPTPTPTATEKPAPTETTKAEASITPEQGEWVLQAIVPYLRIPADGPCYFGHQASLGDGSFASTGSWTDKGCVEGGSASGTVNCSCTWSAPPSYLKVGSTLSMNLSCQANASQTGGDRYTGAQGWVWYTVNPHPNSLAARYGSSRKFLGDVKAIGWTSQFPVSDSKSGSVEVPAGKKGDVLVVVVYVSGQGGSGEMVYKYAYHGTDPVPERGVPAAGLTPQAPEPSTTPTTEPTATPTATPEPTETPEPEVTEMPMVTPTEELGAGEEVIWAISNDYAVVNGAGVPSKFMILWYHRVSRIVNYHWNDGKGAEPGWIALRAEDGKLYGPWKAVGQDGYKGVPNAYWVVTPDVAIPAGIYTVIDSDPLTWSQNEGTEGRGMTWGYGREME